MAVFGKLGALDLQLWRRVLVDGAQQFIAALRAPGVALKAIGPVAFKTIGRVDNQCLTRFGQRHEGRVLQLRLIGADLQHPLLFFGVEHFGPVQQLAFAGRAVFDAFYQAGFLDRFNRVGGDRCQRELGGQLQAGAGHLQQFKQAVGAVFIEEKVIELDLFQFPHMFNHALGFFGGQVEPVFPQVAVFQAAVFREFFLVGHQGKQAGVTTGQAFPGIQNAVVGAFDVGAEVDRVAEQRGFVALHIGLVNAQQGVAEHGRRAVEVRRREDHHRAVRRDVGEPLGELCAFNLGQVVEVQLRLEPAGTGRVYALRVFVAQAHRGIQRLYGGAQFGVGVVGAVGGQKEFVVADIAAPAAQFAGFVMA